MKLKNQEFKGNYMKDIKEIREEINTIDTEIAKLLTKRMDSIREIIEYKRVTGTPIFQPEQEKIQAQILKECYEDFPYEEEKNQIFHAITKMSKLVQAKELLPYNIALIGFMGTGKSTVSFFLKDMLALKLVDIDAKIVKEQGMPITEIFEKYGEEHFRDLETKSTEELIDAKLTVIACGGGLVMRPENVRNLKKSSRIVLLTASPETIYERVKDSTERPILNGHMNVEYIASLMEKRRERYESAADIVINTDGKNVVEICEELIKRIH